MQGLFQSTKAYENVSPADFEKFITEEKNASIVDVRTPGECQTGMIPGAVNIDVTSGDFERKITALDKSKTYLVYCRSGSRSLAACSIMASKGLRCVNLNGGIMSWRGRIA